MWTGGRIGYSKGGVKGMLYGGALGGLSGAAIGAASGYIGGRAGNAVATNVSGLVYREFFSEALDDGVRWALSRYTGIAAGLMLGVPAPQFLAIPRPR